jgi:hypothetical protein
MVLTQALLGMGNNGFQCGAAHTVAPHDGLNKRIREYLAKRGLDAGPSPRLNFVQRARQFRPDEVSSHGFHPSRFQG